MFYGNAQSIVVFVRNLLEILMGFYRTTFIWSHHLIRLNTFLIRVFGNVMVILMIGFQILRLFLCGIWNLCREKLYPSGSSDLVLHSSINRCVVNDRDAMAAHSWDIYLYRQLSKTLVMLNLMSLPLPALHLQYQVRQQHTALLWVVYTALHDWM